MKPGNQRYIITIKNWDRLQQKMARSHREWIRLNTSLLHDPEVMCMRLESRWLWIAVLLHAGCVGPVFKLSPSDARVMFKLRRNADFQPLVDQGFIELSPMTDRQDRQKGQTRQTKKSSKMTVVAKVSNGAAKKSERFDEFWKVWPKKEDKKNARKKWEAMNLDPVADKIIENVNFRLENDVQWKRGYIKNPVTFLNGERWNDEMIQTVGARGEETYAERTARAVSNIEGEAAGEPTDQGEGRGSPI